MITIELIITFIIAQSGFIFCLDLLILIRLANKFTYTFSYTIYIDLNLRLKFKKTLYTSNLNFYEFPNQNP